MVQGQTQESIAIKKRPQPDFEVYTPREPSAWLTLAKERVLGQRLGKEETERHVGPETG